MLAKLRYGYCSTELLCAAVGEVNKEKPPYHF